MKVRVFVSLKEGVLDPQGKAVAHALESLGFSGIEGVRIGKVVELELETADSAVARKQAESMAQALLANEVIEDYQVEVSGT